MNVYRFHLRMNAVSRYRTEAKTEWIASGVMDIVWCIHMEILDMKIENAS